MCTATPVSVARETLLPTAWMMVTTSDGRSSKLRALVDQGSQVSIISRQAAQRLGMKRLPTDIQLNGVADSAAGKSYGCVQFSASACNMNGRALNICALVLPTITADLPIVTISRSSHPQLADLQLADTSYWQSGRIDVLLGAEVVAEMLRHGVRHADGLVAQETLFGWMLSGTAASLSIESHTVTCSPLQMDTSIGLDVISEDDKHVEMILNTTTMRNVLLALLCMMICTLLLIAEPQTCTYMFVCVLPTLRKLSGLMQRWGLKVDLVSCEMLALECWCYTLNYTRAETYHVKL